MMSRKINLLQFTDRFKIMLTIAFMTIFSVFIVTGTPALGEVLKTRNLINDSTIYKDSVGDSLQIYMDSVEQIKTNLIYEVNDYIVSVAPRSRMSAEHIVNQCLEHDFDITLLLSQGHLETHFATCGSNNCFGLSKKRYSHPDYSVHDYIDLMKRKYIINRTTEQLLASNVHQENNRKALYSSSSTYGIKVSKIRNDIIKNTNIQDLFENIKEMNEIIVEYAN